MARTAVPVVRSTRNAVMLGGTLAAPAVTAGGIAIDQVNGMNILPVKRFHKLVIAIYNSKAGNIVTTIRKGIYPPAEDAGLGDLVLAGQVTVTFNFIAGLDGSRFMQNDGSVNIDWDAGATGVIWAFEAPA